MFRPSGRRSPAASFDMEEVAFGHSAALASAESIKPVGWSDLRGWLRWSKPTAGSGKSMRRSIPTRNWRRSPSWRRGARTPLRCCSRIFAGNRSGARVLDQYARRQQGALRARGRHRPELSTADMIAATRRIMSRRIAPAHVPASDGAGQRDHLARRRYRPHRISGVRNSGPATAAAISAPATSP